MQLTPEVSFTEFFFTYHGVLVTYVKLLISFLNIIQFFFFRQRLTLESSDFDLESSCLSLPITGAV